MCHEGGWAPAPGVDGTGTVHDTYPLEGHNWIIVGDDGVWYAVGFPSAAFRVEGLRVSFRAALRFDRLGVLGRGADLLRIETR
jgi:hypothetical protein